MLSSFRAVAGWVEARTGCPAAEVYASLRALFAERDLPPHLACEMVNVYRDHRPEIDLFPGVRQTLQGLRPVARPGLLSDGPRAVHRAKLQALGIQELFAVVLLKDEPGREFWKPSPVPFERVLALLEVYPDDCACVGDNCAKDFLGALRTRFSTIWARYSGGNYCRRQPPALAYAPDRVADSLPEPNTVLGLG